MSAFVAMLMMVTVTAVVPGERQSANTLITKQYLRRTQPLGAAQNNWALDKFSNLSREDQQRILDQLPPDRRRKIEGELEAYHSLPPTEKQQLNQQYERFKSLPPESQEKIRRAYDRFSQIPPHRRRLIRKELRSLASISPIRQKRYMQSRKFKKGFSKDEQTTIEGLLAAPRSGE